MSVAIEDGPLGIEAVHTWTPPSGSVSGGIPAVTLNDPSELDPLEDAAVVVTSISGLHSLPDITDEREAAMGRPGEIVYDSTAQGKTVVYTGYVIGATYQAMRRRINALRRVFGAQSRLGTQVGLAQPGEGQMEIAPDEAYGSVTHLFTARALSFEVGDEQAATPSSTPNANKRPFVLTLRLADPRMYESVEQLSDGHASGASASITNEGSAPTDPQFRVNVVGDSFTLARGTDVVLTFSDLPGAGWYSIDFRTRAATRESTGEDVTAHLEVANSNWWDPGVFGLESGPNDIGVTGGAWQIYWRHASW